MTALWSARTPREQVLLALLALIATAYITVTFIWHPLQNQRDQLTADIARYSRLASTLETLAQTGLAPAPLTADMPLPTLITTTADAAGLPITRLLPTEGAAEITLADADFATILFWIAALEQDHALRILTVSFTRRPEPGLVATTLTVAR
jgi:general secretion pathway protein M